MIFEETFVQEIKITFFQDNGTIVFKERDCKRANISDGFLVVETKNKTYLYNCSTIKSIEIA